MTPKNFGFVFKDAVSPRGWLDPLASASLWIMTPMEPHHRPHIAPRRILSPLVLTIHGNSPRVQCLSDSFRSTLTYRVAVLTPLRGFEEDCLWVVINCKRPSVRQPRLLALSIVRHRFAWDGHKWKRPQDFSSQGLLIIWLASVPPCGSRSAKKQSRLFSMTRLTMTLTYSPRY